MTDTAALATPVTTPAQPLGDAAEAFTMLEGGDIAYAAMVQAIARAKRSMSQLDVVAKSEGRVGPGYLAMIEAGHRTPSREVLEVRFGSERNAVVVEQLADVAERLEVLPDRILLYAYDGEALLDEINRRGHTPLTSLVRRSSLEDVFLRLTGRTLID